VSWILPSWPYRPLVAAAAIWFYISKFIFPVNLAPLYPKWDVVAHVELFFVLLLAFLTSLALIIYFRKRIDRWILYGLFLFLLNLTPVIGLVPFGYMNHSFVADHFMYLPFVGLALVIARLVDILFREISAESGSGKLLIIAVYVWICALGLAAVKQTWVWRDPTAMWQASLRVNKTSPAVYNNLGAIEMGKGHYDKAISLFRRAIEFGRRFDKPYQNLGEAYRFKGDKDRARQMHLMALRLNPRNTMSGLVLGKMLRDEGKSQEAIEFLKKAIAANPDAAELRDELGVAYNSVGRVEEALQEFDKALALDPLNPHAHVHKGIVLLTQGNIDGAAHMALRALRYLNVPQAHNLLGACYAAKGDLQQALREFFTAYKMQPTLPRVRDNTANVLMDLGKFNTAEKFCLEAARSGLPCNENTWKRIKARIGSSDRQQGH
jgi:Flp pilus assembly protein TadD